MPEPWQIGGFGIYVHWPYCEAKCPYCDFNSHVARWIDHDAWRTAYLAEFDRIAAWAPDRVVSSVFFGGGTPSLMRPDTIETLLDRIASTYHMANDVEITLEANPSSVEAGAFRDFARAGINRVSLGIQALNDDDLRRLGRLHSVDDALTALEIARETFDRVSFDLIYARQNQGMSDWQRELTQALDFGPDHLSLYQLTIEEGTAFGDRFAAGKLQGLPSDDLGSDLYFMTQELCMSAGLLGYEVSNYARPGAESRHNQIYWRAGDYLGLGPGAHGRITSGGKRFETTTDLSPTTWLHSAQAGGATRRSAMSIDDWTTEHILMGLRLAEPYDLKRLKDETGHEISAKRIERLAADGLLTFENDTFGITTQGRPLLNAILLELLRD